MAKQTFTTGQVLTAAQMTSLQQTAMGGGSATAKTANYVLVAADAGTTVAMNAAGSTTITVNTSLFAAGDTVFIQNLGAGACTVTAGTATVSTAGSLVLPQYDAGILYFTATGASIFYDYIQTSAGASVPTATFRDEKSSGNAGGTFTAGAWRTRDLNITQFNNITSASLASNQITLPAGTFNVYVTAPCFDVGHQQARFYNITDSAEAVLGVSNYTRNGATATSSYGLAAGTFTITGSKVFEVQHRCDVTGTSNGFGVEVSWGTEVYATVTIVKVA